jgi:hypothetical protein
MGRRRFVMKEESHDLQETGIPPATRFAPVIHATRFRCRCRAYASGRAYCRSSVGEGWIERSQFTDACASLWIGGELVHLEDLVLHDATNDIRTPTHELTIARDVLRTRSQIL